MLHFSASYAAGESGAELFINEKKQFKRMR